MGELTKIIHPYGLSPFLQIYSTFYHSSLSATTSKHLFTLEGNINSNPFGHVPAIESKGL